MTMAESVCYRQHATAQWPVQSNCDASSTAAEGGKGESACLNLKAARAAASRLSWSLQPQGWHAQRWHCQLLWGRGCRGGSDWAGELLRLFLSSQQQLSQLRLSSRHLHLHQHVCCVEPPADVFLLTSPGSIKMYLKIHLCMQTAAYCLMQRFSKGTGGQQCLRNHLNAWG